MKFVSTIRASFIQIPQRICAEWYNIDEGSGIIQEACKPPLTDSWVKGAALSKAVAYSKIAAMGWTNNGNHIRVYYQEPNLRLKNLVMTTSTGPKVSKKKNRQHSKLGNSQNSC
jgi:hypothetical protein